MFVLTHANTVDYCDPSLCPAGVKHAACGQEIKYGPLCPILNDTRQLVFDDDMIKIALGWINFYRSVLAINFEDEHDLPLAAKMMQLVKHLCIYFVSKNLLSCRAGTTR